MFQLQILDGTVHGARPARCIRVFKFKTIAPALCHHQQVQFGAGVSRPKVGIPGLKHADHMLNCKTLPRCADLRVSLQINQGAQLEQGVQDAAVANVNLGCFDLAFTDIFEPRRKHPDHISACENVQIAAGCIFRGA